MDPFNPQSLISQNRNVKGDEVDLNNTYVQIGVHQPPYRKLGSGNPNAYKSYAISLQEIANAFGITPTPPAADTYLSVSIVDSTYGSDVSGERNNQDKPFQTIDAAIAASNNSDIIVVMPGDYTLAGSIGETGQPINLRFFMYPRVHVNATGFPIVNVNAERSRVVIKGYGVFTNTAFAQPVFQASNGGSVDIEGDIAEHFGGFYGLFIGYDLSDNGPSRLKFNKMTSLDGTGDGFYVIRGHQLEAECPIIEYSRVGCIVESGAFQNTTLKVKGDFYVKDVGGDFSQYSPSFTIFEGAQAVGSRIEIEGNHYDTVTVTPLSQSRSLHSVNNATLIYKGNAQTITTLGNAFNGGNVEIEGDLKESISHAVRINGGAEVRQKGYVYAYNDVDDRYPIRFEGTGGIYINYFPMLYSDNSGGTAYCVGTDGGTPSTDLYFATLISNVELDPAVIPFIPTSTMIIDPNVI